MINKNDYNKIPTRARYSMILGSAIGLVIALAIIVSIWQILHIFPIPKPVFFWYKCIGGLIIGYLGLRLILEPTLGYKRHLYRINDESIDIIKGVFFIEHTVIPIRRMQQIDISIGPINKLFNLADISITTGGGVASIDFLPLDQADLLAENLKKKINEKVDNKEYIVDCNFSKLMENTKINKILFYLNDKTSPSLSKDKKIAIQFENINLNDLTVLFTKEGIENQKNINYVSVDSNNKNIISNIFFEKNVKLNKNMISEIEIINKDERHDKYLENFTRRLKEKYNKKVNIPKKEKNTDR